MIYYNAVGTAKIKGSITIVDNYNSHATIKDIANSIKNQAATRLTPLFIAFQPQRPAFLPVQAIDSFVIDFPSLTHQQHRQASETHYQAEALYRWQH
jgi:hypothetical protein